MRRVCTEKPSCSAFPRPHEGKRSALTLLSARANYKAGGEAGGGSTAWVLVSSATAWRKPSWGLPLSSSLPLISFNLYFICSALPPLIRPVSSLTSFLSLLLFLPVLVLVLAAARLHSFPPSFCFYPQITAEKQNISGASLNRLQPTEPEPLLQQHESHDVIVIDKLFVGDAPLVLNLVASLG